MRTAPEREDISRAERFYQTLNQGRLPSALRRRWPGVGGQSKLLQLGLLGLLVAGFFFPSPQLAVAVGVGLIVQWSHTSWWSRRLRLLNTEARKQMLSDVTCVLYTGRNDELAAIELMLRMRQAELRAIVGRSGDTSNMILETAESVDLAPVAERIEAADKAE